MSSKSRQSRDFQVYLKIIGRLMRAGAWGNLQRVIAKLHPSDLAEVLSHLPPVERALLMPRLMRLKKLGSTLLEMHEDVLSEVLESMDCKLIASLLVDMPSDDASDFMHNLSPERIEEAFQHISDQVERRRLRKILSYTSDTAGSMMQTDFLALPETQTVNQAVSLIRSRYQDLPIFYLYTLDEDSRLSGVISFRKLLLTDGEQPLSKIAMGDVAKVTEDEDQVLVARLVYRYDLLAVPVVDSKNHMVGIITVDDVMDVMEDEVSEDVYKLAGSDVEELMYGDRIFKISKVRLPWLLISVFTGLLTALIIGSFEETLETAIVLASFIPVIAGMAGNIGTQSSSITVRGLAVGRLLPSKLASIVWREMRVGVLLGLTCGTLVALIGSFWFGNPALGLVVGMSMIAGISFAATTGAFMPMIFAKFNIDPAVASGPLVTTLNDCVSTIIYLGIASSMLSYLT